GVSGAVSAANSLVGSNANDQVGIGSVTKLNSGNYVVNSYYWNNGGTDSNALGAVTWGSGTTGVMGPVTSSNSLVGSTPGDQVGSNYVTQLYYNNPNGNYVVLSPTWGSNGTAAAGLGAVTWGSGTAGVF